jgi:cytochrome c-type biogenesis protein CcmH/NrfG
MRGIILAIITSVCLIGGWCTASRAQQPDDPRIAIYRQLLSEANDRVVAALGQNQTLEAQNKQLKADLDKAKTPPEEKSK